MTDRELLKLAAKAAGIQLNKMGMALHPCRAWDPLTDDADALKLAVRLHIDLELNNGSATAIWIDSDLSEAHSVTEACDEEFDGWRAKEAAARRAIVRAAAEIQIARGED